jgi:hypothetical protein
VLQVGATGIEEEEDCKLLKVVVNSLNISL